MKLLVKFLIAAVFITETLAISPGKNTFKSDGWFVPTVDGKFFWMTRELFEKEYNQKTERISVPMKYYLYTRDILEKPEQLYLGDNVTLASSSFKNDRPTRIIVHGWQQDYRSNFNFKVRQALLKFGDFNVISVDWSSISMSLNYASSMSAIPTVGKNIASFIDFLNEHANMPFQNLTLIGFSLGAHACGYAGKNVKRGRVDFITGLDPAGPLYDFYDCTNRLCSTDANFVESIHTSTMFLGFQEPIGKAAYYPNGGKSQPGCPADLAGICSHIRSYVYYAEALLKNNFVAIKCRKFEGTVVKKCDKSVKSANMGSFGSLTNEGSYYVPVNTKSLFGTG